MQSLEFPGSDSRIIDTGRDIQVETTVEGIETERQKQVLGSLEEGVHFAAPASIVDSETGWRGI